SCMEGFDPLQAAADIAIEAVAGVAASYVFALANTIPGFGQAFGAVVAGIAYQAVSDVLGELFGENKQSNANCAPLVAYVPEAADNFRFHNFVMDVGAERWHLADKGDWWAEVGWARFDPEIDTIGSGGARGTVPEGVMMI